MESLHSPWLCKAAGPRGIGNYDAAFSFKRLNPKCLQKPFLGSFPASIIHLRSGLKTSRQPPYQSSVKCEKDESVEHVSVERPPYYSYLDSTSGQLEPASGARAPIPGEEYWPEGTANQVRAARAPEPTGKSLGSPSYGKNPGSRRKKNKKSVVVGASESSETSTELSDPEESSATYESSRSSVESNDQIMPETSDNVTEEPKEGSSEYVVYQTEPKEEEEEGYALDKKLGLPHPFVDPKVKKTMEGTLTSEELWWNWRKPDKEQWSKWQKRRPDVESVFLKAMAETGQVKLHGDQPTETEISLYRARRHIFKGERLQAEQERLEKMGPMAYYSEWVKGWKRDTSREAIQKHFEETGEDENMQLIAMFTHQSEKEFRIMMGTDVRIKRDPLAMRMREDQIKQIWGGDPVYPTINYIQDPNEIIDYRGPDFHEPTPEMLDYLKEHGKIITREELEKILAKEKTEEVEMTDMDEAMAKAVDIGEDDDEGEEGEFEGDEEGKISRNWSVLKSTPELRKKKDMKPKKDRLSLDEAVNDSENLTDFLLDFEEEE